MSIFTRAKNKSKRLFKKILQKLSSSTDPKAELLAMDQDGLSYFITDIVKEKANSLPPLDAITFLFSIDNRLYELQGKTSVRYGNGVHSKHRHINYHQFFMDNIEKGNTVLDIGSHEGELTRDIARAAAPGLVTGIEIDENNYKKAIENKTVENVRYIFGDATKDLPDQEFDVITLSNVLEHIDDRPGLLSTLVQKYKPKKVIIRVPVFDRDWRVPLKREIGIDYRLDSDHRIEYTEEIFRKEMLEAGLDVAKLQIRWGEIWATLKPTN